MLKPDDILTGKEQLKLKTMVVGASGTGKSYLAATFPKSMFIITEPGGEDTWLTVPELRRM